MQTCTPDAVFHARLRPPPCPPVLMPSIPNISFQAAGIEAPTITSASLVVISVPCQSSRVSAAVLSSSGAGVRAVAVASREPERRLASLCVGAEALPSGKRVSLHPTAGGSTRGLLSAPREDGLPRARHTFTEGFGDGPWVGTYPQGRGTVADPTAAPRCTRGPVRPAITCGIIGGAYPREPLESGVTGSTHTDTHGLSKTAWQRSWR